MLTLLHNILRKTLLIFGICVWIISCNTTDTPDDALMSNGSFESGGSFSTSGWQTSGAASSSDVPTDGGSFSLRLNPQSVPGEGYALYRISDLSGAQVLTISGFIKSFGSWPGVITVQKEDADNTVTILASANSVDPAWVEKTLEISSTFNTGDELIIKLSAGSTEIPIDTKYALFDLITVE